MSKEEVYSQITSFNKKIIEEKETKSKKFYYVQDDVAIDKANFFNHLINNGNEGFTTSFNKIIDLCYGSGNLTSHIIFDCNLEYEKVTLNDKDIENRNNDFISLKQIAKEKIKEGLFCASKWCFEEWGNIMIFEVN